MTSAKDDWDDRLEMILVTFDEALAAGQDPDSIPLPDLTPLEREEIDGIKSCLCALELAWPRLASHASLDTPEQILACETERDLDRDGMSFDMLGPYRIVKVLGRGGMGVVFQAEDPQLKRPVALKAMKPALVVRESLRKRFLREAQAAAAIKHDHIVTIFQVGEDRGIPYLAMELLEGESLDARIRRKGILPTAEVLRTGCEIASGLAAAHERGLIHRDIKPANIWLESISSSSMGVCLGTAGIRDEPRTVNYRVKILDFGLARTIDDEVHLTQSGLIVGTPSFMAPEQTRSEPIDHRCDLFSLGCVLYLLSTGRMPFDGRDIMSTLMAVATFEPARPSAINGSIPSELSDLIMRLLAKDREHRPASAQEVVATLQRLERGSPNCVPHLNGPAALAFDQKGRDRRTWARAGISAGAIVLLLGLSAAAVVLMNKRRDHSGHIEVAAVPDVSRLLEDLRSEQPEAKVTALNGLEAVGSAAKQEAGQAVAACLMDRNSSVQDAARKALDRIDPAVSSLAHTALHGVHQNERINALQELRKMGSQGRSAVPILMMIVSQRQDAADTASHSDASYAVLALGEVGYDQDGMAEMLIGFTRSSDFRVRDGACFELVKARKVKDHQAIVDALTVCLKDSASSVRYRSAQALGKLADAATAKTALKRLAESDPSSEVRDAARQSLMSIEAGKH
ncbi:hypothetical protein AYO40_00545 [Planctomycetaceae bacterium SCGC AG-212-D15]|nr:hypothetical protein AYO40_00545 [Planctomycetaceae bacterium SCGC AG-212-D15]